MHDTEHCKIICAIFEGQVIQEAWATWAAWPLNMEMIIPNGLFQTTLRRIIAQKNEQFEE